jgi:hypothetical protein
MSQEENKGGSGAATFAVVVMLVALPILYVLSTGPVGLLFSLTGGSRESWAALYFPVRVVAMFVPPFSSAVEWWVNLWTGWFPA